MVHLRRERCGVPLEAGWYQPSLKIKQPSPKTTPVEFNLFLHKGNCIGGLYNLMLPTASMYFQNIHGCQCSNRQRLVGQNKSGRCSFWQENKSGNGNESFKNRPDFGKDAMLGSGSSSSNSDLNAMPGYSAPGKNLKAKLMPHCIPGEPISQIRRFWFRQSDKHNYSTQTNNIRWHAGWNRSCQYNARFWNWRHEAPGMLFCQPAC